MLGGVEVELRYGRGNLAVRLPDDLEVTVVRRPEMPVPGAPAEAVERALRRPVAARPPDEEARGRRSACILVCDLTRPVPNALLLPPLVRELLAGGIDASRITVLVATGLHRPHLGAELEELVGDRWVLSAVRVQNHDALDDAAHVDLGRTQRGTPVKLDRRFVEADLKVVTGLVEPHFMAGYSGGGKVIAPGVAHRDTITAFHAFRFMAHPRAESCVLEGNPLHEEQISIAGLLGRILAVNSVVDGRHRPSFVNYGELAASHAEAVAFAERFALVPVPRRFRTVVTSAAGHPFDRTYYQTVQGMVAPMDILEPGADLVVASECAEGMGSREYREAQRRLAALGPEGFLRDIAAKPFADVDEWQTQMQLKPLRRARVHLFSGALPPADRPLTGVDCVESVEAAVLESVGRSGDRRVAVIPEGPCLVPVYRPFRPAA